LITCSGSSGAIRFDDAYLGPTASDGVWRPATVAALQQLNPGYIRDDLGTRGDSYNIVSDSAARQLTFYSGDSQPNDVYSIPEFFALNSLVGSHPWISIPVTLLDSEYTALGNTLASLQATYIFPEVLVEFGNGDATGLCGGACFNQNGSLSQTAYAAVANRAFGLIQAAAGSGANLQYAGSAQWGSGPPSGADAQYMATLLPAAQYIDVAPYWHLCQDSGDSIATDEANMWNDPQEDTAESIMASALSALQPYGAGLAFYGMAPNTLGGSDTTAGRTPIVAGAWSAGAEAQTILRGLTAGIPVMNSLQFTQFEMGGWDNYNGCANQPAGTLVPIRGVVNFIDTPMFRPRGLALQLLNNYAIGGNFYAVNGRPQRSHDWRLPAGERLARRADQFELDTDRSYHQLPQFVISATNSARADKFLGGDEH
jgi:hypothetical protein